MWPFKRQEPSKEALAELTIEALTAIMATAETYRSQEHVVGVLSGSTLSTADIANTWHALNVVIAMAACKESVSNPAEKLYVKCACAIWDYYPNVLRNKLFPDGKVFDYQVFFKILAEQGSFKGASVMFPQDLQFEAEAWDADPRSLAVLPIVLNKIYERYCKVFRALQAGLQAAS